MYMMMLVLNDPDKCTEVMDAWDKAGAPGVTVLASSGLARVREKLGLSDDFPLIPSLSDFFQQEDSTNRTILSIIRDRPVVDAIIQATQAVLGDLNEPNTGILVVLPILEAYGLDRPTDPR